MDSYTREAISDEQSSAEKPPKDKDIRIPLTPKVLTLCGVALLVGGVGGWLVGGWLAAIQAGLYFPLLAYVACLDRKLHLVPYWPCAVIAGIGLTNLLTVIPAVQSSLSGKSLFGVAQLFLYPSWGSMLAGLAIGVIPLLLAAILTKGGIGGGDILLMGSSALLLGVVRICPALIIGLLISIIWEWPKLQKQKNQGESASKTAFAMVPYLAVGCMAAFFI